MRHARAGKGEVKWRNPGGGHCSHLPSKSVLLLSAYVPLDRRESRGVELAMCMWDDDTVRRSLRTSTCRVRGRYGRDFRLVSSHIQLGRLPVLHLHVYVLFKGTYAVLPGQADICGAVRPAYRTPCVGQHSKSLEQPRLAKTNEMDHGYGSPAFASLRPRRRFMGAV
ncbi:hypothetical protein LZ31DRAFT_94259 [Colletotrichum somersetense]|nr:hypothetical protein LZ31DRAFT_94259 [Colletotrichum somersetense]